MKRSASNAPWFRTPRPARRVALALAAALLLGALNLHALAHQHPELAADEVSLQAGHPEPFDLDQATSDPCIACLLGLKLQGPPIEAQQALDRPRDHGRLTGGTSPSGVSALADLLPPGRAPPLS